MTTARLRLTTLPASRFRLALWAVFLGALGLSVLLLRGIAHAQGAAPAPTAPGIDWTFWLALAGALLGGLSALLHVIAPRTKNTIDDQFRDDVDEVLAWWRGRAAGVVPGAARPADALASRNPQSGRARLVTIVAIAVIGSALAGMAMIGCTKAELGAAATSGEHAVVNCTGTALGSTPALDIATLVAIANTVVAERAKCTPAGVSLDWKCVETDLIGEGKTLGGCALVGLITGAASASSASMLASPTPAPGRAELEDFRTRIAPGATFHTASGDI